MMHSNHVTGLFLFMQVIFRIFIATNDEKSVSIADDEESSSIDDDEDSGSIDDDESGSIDDDER